MKDSASELAQRYGAMSDAELRLLGEQADDLTDVAREALLGELSRRGISLPEAEGAEWDAQQLVVLKRFLNLHEAQLAKGQLDSSGIPAYLVDDNMVRLDWFISNLLGGVKLAVPVEHEEEARAIMEQPIPESFDVDEVGTFEQPRCPKCQSLNINFEALDKLYSYGSAWAGFPIPFAKNQWRCNDCGATWNDPDAEPGDA